MNFQTNHFQDNPRLGIIGYSRPGSRNVFWSDPSNIAWQEVALESKSRGPWTEPLTELWVFSLRIPLAPLTCKNMRIGAFEFCRSYFTYSTVRRSLGKSLTPTDSKQNTIRQTLQVCWKMIFSEGPGVFRWYFSTVKSHLLTSSVFPLAEFLGICPQFYSGRFLRFNLWLVCLVHWFWVLTLIITNSQSTLKPQLSTKNNLFPWKSTGLSNSTCQRTRFSIWPRFSRPTIIHWICIRA